GEYVEEAAIRATARIVLYDILDRAPPVLSVAQDSHGVSSKDVENDPIALQVVSTRRVSHGTVERNDDRFAELAVPLTGQGPVLLLSASLRDSLANVHLVERRLVIAGIFALLVPVLVGYGGAAPFSRPTRAPD